MVTFSPCFNDNTYTKLLNQTKLKAQQQSTVAINDWRYTYNCIDTSRVKNWCLDSDLWHEWSEAGCEGGQFYRFTIDCEKSDYVFTLVTIM